MKPRAHFRKIILAGAVLASVALLAAPMARAQQAAEPDPAAALSAALTAACTSDETQFATYLTTANAAAFMALPRQERLAFIKRFSLSDTPGKVLISSDDQGHTILRCETPQQTAVFRFGGAQTKENLSFITITVVKSQQAEFGMVREDGGWKLLSLGLVLLDVPQLAQQWAENDLTQREDAAMATLGRLAEALEKYRRAFGNLPQTLSQLGPAPDDQVSPEQASLLSVQLANGSEGGYRFRYRTVPAADGGNPGFQISATPEQYDKSGRRSFLLDPEGKIHGADGGGAAVTADAPLVTPEKTP